MDWIETWIAICAVFLAVCAGEAINTNQRVKEIKKILLKHGKDAGKDAGSDSDESDEDADEDEDK